MATKKQSTKRKKLKKASFGQRDSVSEKILRAVLKQVPFDGWSEAAYAHGLNDAGVGRGDADLLLPAGIRDVIEVFLADADAAMLEKIAHEPGFARFRVRDKIAFAVRARLEHLTLHREAVRRLNAWYAVPTHLPLGLKRLSKTVDLMWREAGDVSTDFNFYTKRILLAGVLQTTSLFWLDDASPGCRDSWEFLDRRIGEVLKIGKTISLAKEWKPSEIADFVRRKVSGS